MRWNGGPKPREQPYDGDDRGGRASEKTTYHVFLANDRWHVTVNGRGRKWGDFASREEAIREAKLLADAAAPSEIIVYASDGSAVNEYRHRRQP
jgi:uncharacterized protein DUF2188